MASTLTLVNNLDTFHEDVGDLGAMDFNVNLQVVLELNGNASFNPTIAYKNLYAINVPPGWTFTASPYSSNDTKKINLFFTGNATDHAVGDSITNLGIYLERTHGINGETYFENEIDELPNEGDWGYENFNVTFIGGAVAPPDVVVVETIKKYDDFNDYVLDLQCKWAALGSSISDGYGYGKYCKTKNKDFKLLRYIIGVLQRHNQRMKELNILLNSNYDHYCLNEAQLLKMVDYAYIILKRY